MICVYLVPKSYPNKTHEKFDIYLINKKHNIAVIKNEEIEAT